MTAVLGIDLGTERSSAAVAVVTGPGAAPAVVANVTIPTAAWAAGSGRIVAGEKAILLAKADRETLARFAMRLAGRTFRTPWIREYVSRAPCSIVEGPGGFAAFEYGGKATAPAELLAATLEELKKVTETLCGRSAERAVIAVPALFDVFQRRAVRDAALIAGIDRFELACSPLCAALACGPGGGGKRRVVVVDLGAGFLEVAVLLNEGPSVKVVGYGGDVFLGGQDLAREREDEALSGGPDAAPAAGLTPRQAEGVAASVRKAICALGAEPGKADRVILLGGVFKAEEAGEPLRGIFGDGPSIHEGPPEAVAEGAALLGLLEPGALEDVVPYSLGLETEGGGYSEIVARNERFPGSRFGFFTPASEGQTEASVLVVQGAGDHGVPAMAVGRYELKGLAPRPLGETLVKVGFGFSGQLPTTVTAGDTRGAVETFRLRPMAGLSEEEALSKALAAEIRRSGAGRGKEFAGLADAAERLAAAVTRLRGAEDPRAIGEAWGQASGLAEGFRRKADAASARLGPEGASVGALASRLRGLVPPEPPVAALGTGAAGTGLAEYRYGFPPES
ncbi:MAG: Hsp70 family protein [Deltaproteobacteria bacterium]|jgi:molecular chaperone DnaK|nr:Hsp70 family protein [Deltaproteobacteria bacterium]